MPTQLHRKLAITLLFSLAILLALAGPSSANGISPDTARRRDHANLNRMIKMRAASPALARRQLPNNNNNKAAGAGNPADPSDPPSPQSPNSPSSSTSSTSSTSTSSTSSSSSTSTESTSTSSTTSKSSTTSTPTPTTTSTSTPSRPTDSTTSATSAERNVASDAPGDAPPSVESVTLTSHVAAASATNSSNNSQIGGSSLSHTTITILIVLAASIGGCAIIWTIIRKWKFRPSAQFEDRLEPVNWQPTEHDSGLPSHRRMASDASSFHSAGHDNMGLSRSNSGGAYNAGRSLTPLPDHDFTAGPAILAPVGGYADLTRGPSPQPQMQEALQRAPSFNQGYENYTGPAPPQEAYDYNRAGAGY